MRTQRDPGPGEFGSQAKRSQPANPGGTVMSQEKPGEPLYYSVKLVWQPSCLFCFFGCGSNCNRNREAGLPELEMRTHRKRPWPITILAQESVPCQSSVQVPVNHPVQVPLNNHRAGALRQSSRAQSLFTIIQCQFTIIESRSPDNHPEHRASLQSSSASLQSSRAGAL